MMNGMCVTAKWSAGNSVSMAPPKSRITRILDRPPVITQFYLIFFFVNYWKTKSLSDEKNISLFTFLGNYWIDNIRCGGSETEMSKCRFDSWGENDCDPSEAAGVVCDSSEAKTTSKTIVDRSMAETKKVKKYKIKVILIHSYFLCLLHNTQIT